MRTSVNPGSWLELVANLELVDLAKEGKNVRIATVRDRTSGSGLSLAGLLETFKEDPSDDVIGWVRITIEPVNPHSLDVNQMLARTAS